MHPAICGGYLVTVTASLIAVVVDVPTSDVGSARADPARPDSTGAIVQDVAEPHQKR